ncbi:high affinity cGMP-specific 3' 5'-cyclic phosphodiesterase 9A, partial [Clonorchis sinensis]
MGSLKTALAEVQYTSCGTKNQRMPRRLKYFELRSFKLVLRVIETITSSVPHTLRNVVVHKDASKQRLIFTSTSKLSVGYGMVYASRGTTFSHSGYEYPVSCIIDSYEEFFVQANENNDVRVMFSDVEIKPAQSSQTEDGKKTCRTNISSRSRYSKFCCWSVRASGTRKCAKDAGTASKVENPPVQSYSSAKVHESCGLWKFNKNDSRDLSPEISQSSPVQTPADSRVSKWLKPRIIPIFRPKTSPKRFTTQTLNSLHGSPPSLISSPPQKNLAPTISGHLGFRTDVEQPADTNKTADISSKATEYSCALQAAGSDFGADDRTSLSSNASDSDLRQAISYCERRLDRLSQRLMCIRTYLAQATSQDLHQEHVVVTGQPAKSVAAEPRVSLKKVLDVEDWSASDFGLVEHQINQISQKLQRIKYHIDSIRPELPWFFVEHTNAYCQLRSTEGMAKYRFAQNKATRRIAFADHPSFADRRVQTFYDATDALLQRVKGLYIVVVGGDKNAFQDKARGSPLRPVNQLNLLSKSGKSLYFGSGVPSTLASAVKSQRRTPPRSSFWGLCYECPQSNNARAYLGWIGIAREPHWNESLVPGKNAPPPNPQIQLIRRTEVECRDIVLRYKTLCDESVPYEVRMELRRSTFNNWPWSDAWLIRFVRQMFMDLGLIEHFRISASRLDIWLCDIYRRYNRVPFHNYKHAFMVTQMAYSVIWAASLTEYLDKEEQLILLASAICHDLDHPGFNNAYQINASTVLAIRYNDQSPLENHHAAMAFDILKTEEANPFDHLEEETYKRIREGIIRCILATDMSRHNDILNQFVTVVLGDLATALSIDKETQRPRWVLEKTLRDLTLMIIMKVCDISNEARPLHVSAQWINRLLAEFFHQSDYEKLAGLPVAPFMDREKVTKSASQCGFIRFVILPLFEALAKLLPQIQ